MIQQNGITCSLKMPKISSASCAFPTHGITCSHESSFPAIVWASLFLESMRPSLRFQSILVVSSHSNLPTLTWLRDDSDTISCSEWISITRWTSARTQTLTNRHATWDFRKKFNFIFTDDPEILKTTKLRWSIDAYTTQDSNYCNAWNGLHTQPMQEFHQERTSHAV